MELEFCPIIVLFQSILRYLFVSYVNETNYIYSLDKYDYQQQEAWDHYDEKWDPYTRPQGQSYPDQYYG